MLNINKSVIDLLKNSKSVAIFVHVNPDGDCLGSALALKLALNKIGKHADMFSEDTPAENYNFLPEINTINKPTQTSYDLGVAVDCASLNRLGKKAEIFNKIETTIKIDHHKTSEDFATINVLEDVSSSGIILYYYIKELCELDADIACGLFAGVSSDTGSFMHSNTGSLEHFVAYKLLEYNFDLETLNYMLFKRKTLPQIMLEKRAYSSLSFYESNKIAFIVIKQSDLKETQTVKNDTAPFPNIAINIEGVQMGVAICEEKYGLFSVSVRTKEGVDASLIAKHFGGGGHVRSAGCNVFGQANTVKAKIIEAFNIVTRKKR